MTNFKGKLMTGICILLINISFSQTELERISVKGNNFVTPNGETIVFRGLNTSDPDKLESQNHWNKAYFEEIKAWGANIVRFPVHPTAWTKRGKENYLKLLDDGIKWATELHLYVIIDWHSIGNLQTEMYQHDMYDTTLKQTYDFWRTIAVKYGKNTTVAFYELFNEPTTYHNTLGTANWDDWKAINEQLITIVRANGGEGVPLVAGFNWAYDLTPVLNNPINAEGIGYVSHPYPEKVSKPWEDKWTKDWGFVKEKYPLMLTEIGFCGPDDEGAHSPVIGDETYGDAITNYCDKQAISYLVWVFDPQWAPRLFQNWKFKPSRHGKYFKKKLQSYKSDLKKTSATHENIEYFGRHDIIKKNVALISPGAYASINFFGDFCEIYLKPERPPYNYASLELDGKYLGRIKLNSEATSPIRLNVSKDNKTHHLKIIKESEASNGYVLFSGIKTENVLANNETSKYTIEFIGDSITCGAASDGSTTPCDEGEYFDHENVYYAYGPNTARALNANFMLSSVSGYGMYRNWNDEHENEPILPEVYENLYLDTNTSKPYNFKTQPDLVSICLGTNDLSQGDGKKPRLPFNKKTYTNHYIDFVKTVYKNYPNTQIVLINSPVNTGENNDIIVSCLKDVQSYFAKNGNKNLPIFQFKKAYTNGCMWHPSVAEHKEMAEKLAPFLKTLLTK